LLNNFCKINEPCKIEASRAVAFAFEQERKVRTPKGGEPDNVRAFEKSGDDKCNRKQTSQFDFGFWIFDFGFSDFIIEGDG
jgi:hypothetical protein